MHVSLHHYGIVSIYLLTLFCLPVALAGLPRYRPIRRNCGVDPPSASLRHSHRWLRENEPRNNELWNATSVKNRYWTIDHSTHNHTHRQRSEALAVFTIETYMHIVSDTDSASPSSRNYVTDETIQRQFNYIVESFANSSIGYRLAGVTRTTNDVWARNGDDVAMKQALRQGTYSTLNIYFQSQLRSNDGYPDTPTGSTLLGFCTLPTAGITSSTRPSRYITDGCNILSATMPGGTYGGYNLGGTTVHEVGRE